VCRSLLYEWRQGKPLSPLFSLSWDCVGGVGLDRVQMWRNWSGEILGVLVTSMESWAAADLRHR
jgi:hypothetical protein